jgi:type III secretory pathway lipoprotein EscJ
MWHKWRRASVLLVIGVAIGCGDQPIVHDLAEEDANRLVDRLHVDSIDASKVSQGDGKWRLDVPATKAIEAISTVQRERLLGGLNRETPDSPSLLAPRETQMFAHERALSITLEKTLLSIDGIYDARIHLNIENADDERSLFSNFGEKKSAPNQNSSAAVLLVVDGKAEGVEASVQRLVSGATGIPEPNVAVIMSRALKPKIKRALAVADTFELAGSEKKGFEVTEMLQSTVLQVAAAVLLAMCAFLVAARRRNRMLRMERVAQSSGTWAHYKE